MKVTERSILMITDDRCKFSAAAAAFEDEGYSVLFENDGLHAIATASSTAPELVISELAMPAIDGLRLCTMMRHDATTAATPILLIGDLPSLSPIVSDSFRCGATEYIQRPFDDVRLVAACHDILRPRRAADSLASEHIFNALMGDKSGVTVMIDGRDGTVLFESPSASKTFGYGPGRLLGRDIFELVHSADRAEFRVFLDALHWGSHVMPIELRILNEDGTWRLIESEGRYVDDQRFDYAIALTLRSARSCDIDQLPAALGEEFDQNTSGVGIFSASGHLIRGNRKMADMLGTTEAKIGGMAFAEILYPADPEADRRALVEVLCGQRRSHRMMNGYRTGSGVCAWGRLSFAPVHGSTVDTSLFVVILEDPDQTPALRALANHPLDLTHWILKSRYMRPN
ncbi:MAG: PAS domain S-box protein [Pyrinomonadaceae bacterium]